MKVKPGQAYEAKDKDRGLYIALGRNWKGQQRCLVVLEDRLNPSELAGGLTTINEDWLLEACRRVG